MKKTILLTTLCFLCTVLIFISCNRNTNITTSVCNFGDTHYYSNPNGCYLFLPNIFTPNNDGINDIFMPLQSNITGYSMVIKDGPTTLFSTTNVNIGWDGTNNSVLMPADDYHVEVTANLCGTVVNFDRCFYLAEYNSSGCIPKPTTTQLVFSDMVDPVTGPPLFPTADTLCP